MATPAEVVISRGPHPEKIEKLATCPLCASSIVKHHFRDNARNYWQCGQCLLIFVAPEERISAAEEKRRYDFHQNDPDDPEYRKFLWRVAGPMMERVPAGAEGLDFGCGPGPALARMMTEHGRPTSCYDPFYVPDPEVWSRSYDFITATEVLEHLHHPGKELARLFGALKTGGWLGVMTKQAPGKAEFAAWHYIRDPTHVCFFSAPTFEYLASRHGAMLVFLPEDVVLFQKR